ncbi:molybdate ABC transporter substrate-binding protein [Halobacillus sp. Marseille-Q1614]|uniref:molybdate ABC transporter substrate-binding protein n=1 Tax=Halobacillus sp. Marseille-Q1614 TaxID=2709134 RepID=UPI0015707FAA|nr:molybdate ABC transporter substrate-binding protein [Halobacillus sp. Marseille-Q1614]
MFTKTFPLCFIFLFILTACSTSNEQKAEVNLTISAASSLQEAMEEIINTYEEKDSDLSFSLNTSSSGKLAQQIHRGAPVDIYISANERWTDWLLKNEHIKADSLNNIAGNKLVLIAPKEKQANVSALENLQLGPNDQIAIGEPESAPIGRYAKQSIQSIGKWEAWNGHFVYSNDARQTVTYVASGNADYGIVYQSDAKISDQVEVLAEVSEEIHDPIIYPAAITTSSSHPEEAEKFVDYLNSEEAQDILRTYGFYQ